MPCDCADCRSKAVAFAALEAMISLISTRTRPVSDVQLERLAAIGWSVETDPNKMD
jgi:hypothetical protein